MASTRRKTLGAIAAAMPVAMVLYGYTIKPGDDIHERMTRASVRCLQVQSSRPTACDTNISKDLPAPDMVWIRTMPKLPDLEAAVRWPDDPTSQLSLPTAIKAVAAITKCKARAEKLGAAAVNLNKGLLCNSNVGTMQFFHAQASLRGEPASDTYYKVMHWAQLLYDISGKYTDAQLDQPYCDLFSASGDAFDRAMLPAVTSVKCGDVKHPGWTVRTLFTTRCRNILTSRFCSVDKGADRYDRTRMYATGALLHLIQDSYSQSHCVRGDCVVESNKVVAKVECTPIRMFTTYVGQHNHADADRDPVFAPSCKPGPDMTDITDPISAGARILWDIRNHASDAIFRADMEKVFGTEAHARELPAADLGKCFSGSL